VPLGVADIKRPGRDLTVAAYGRMVGLCLEAAEKAAADGIDVEVVDPRTLLPLDTRTLIASVQKTSRLLIVHEAVQTGGLGGEIAAVVTGSEAFFHLDAPVKRVCGWDVPVPYSPGLEEAVVPTVDRVIDGIYELMR
jgi:pyruvate dehydrogenase E1 component beta subunit